MQATVGLTAAVTHHLGDVRHICDEDAWVTEWQYGDARPLIAGPLTRAGRT
ncbi:Adenylate kinase-related kinase [Gordonia terrae C-6]|uniref:Adenylate kinase-related kinase n=1 Tax=Gordonia terrae C-6 TaxID=1316928 RepID=R7YDU7_9ACTN|nr:hypothetical protein [Gordonia terrae]EON34200.1 Adenylate kinase-related kinase [Gordonia terrae C-6]